MTYHEIDRPKGSLLALNSSKKYVIVIANKTTKAITSPTSTKLSAKTWKPLIWKRPQIKIIFSLPPSVCKAVRLEYHEYAYRQAEDGLLDKKKVHEKFGEYVRKGQHRQLQSLHHHDHEYGARKVLTKAERIVKLENYSEELKKELAAVEEHIKEIGK